MGDDKPSHKHPPITILKKSIKLFKKQLVNSQPGGLKSDKLPNDTEQFTSKN